MCRTIDKVTALITRPSQDGHDLLLFEHPQDQWLAFLPQELWSGE